MQHTTTWTFGSFKRIQRRTAIMILFFKKTIIWGFIYEHPEHKRHVHFMLNIQDSLYMSSCTSAKFYFILALSTDYTVSFKGLMTNVNCLTTHPLRWNKTLWKNNYIYMAQPIDWLAKTFRFLFGVFNYFLLFEFIVPLLFLKTSIKLFGWKHNFTLGINN